MISDEKNRPTKITLEFIALGGFHFEIFDFLGGETSVRGGCVCGTLSPSCQLCFGMKVFQRKGAYSFLQLGIFLLCVDEVEHDVEGASEDEG